MPFPMKKIIRIILILGIAGIFSFAFVYYYVFMRPKRDVSKSDVAFSVNADSLISEFRTNESAANAKYLDKENGKIVGVSGVVAQITEENGKTSIVLKNNPDLDESVICYMDSSQYDAAKMLKQGDKINIKGVCTGWVDITSEVDLIQCLIIK
jgi:hypothetical protein